MLCNNPVEQIFEMPRGWDHEEDVNILNNAPTGEMITFSVVDPPVPEERTKRPSNCFFLFRKDFKERYILPEGVKKLTAAEMSRLAGDAWRTLPVDQVDYWRMKALNGKTEHERKHPSYQYRPIRKSKASKRNPNPSRAASPTSLLEPGPSALHITAYTPQDREAAPRSRQRARPSSSYRFPASGGASSRAPSPVPTPHWSEPVTSPTSEEGPELLEGEHWPSPYTWNAYGWEGETLEWAPVPGLSTSTRSSFSSFSSDCTSTDMRWNGFVADVQHLSGEWVDGPAIQGFPETPYLWEGVCGEDESLSHQWTKKDSTGADLSTVFISDDLHESLSRFARDVELTPAPPHPSHLGLEGEKSGASGAYEMEAKHAAHAFNVHGLNGMQLEYGFSAGGREDTEVPVDFPSPWSRRYSIDSGISD